MSQTDSLVRMQLTSTEQLAEALDTLGLRRLFMQRILGYCSHFAAVDYSAELQHA